MTTFVSFVLTIGLYFLYKYLKNNRQWSPIKSVGACVLIWILFFGIYGQLTSDFSNETNQESNETNQEEDSSQSRKIRKTSEFYGIWKLHKVTAPNEWFDMYFTIFPNGRGSIKSVVHNGPFQQPGVDLDFQTVTIQGDYVIFCNDGASYNSCPKLVITNSSWHPLQTLDGDELEKIN